MSLTVVAVADNYAANYALTLEYIDHKLDDYYEVRQDVEKMIYRHYRDNTKGIIKAMEEFDSLRHKHALHTKKLESAQELNILQQLSPPEAWRRLGPDFPYLCLVRSQSQTYEIFPFFHCNADQ